jgi:hypothetical protein
MPKKKLLIKNLPKELQTPIRADRLLSLAAALRRKGAAPRGLLQMVQTGKLAILAEFLGKDWPSNEQEWIQLAIDICTKFEVVPGFRIVETGAGRKKDWPEWKNVELLVDVALLRQKRKKLSDERACHYIAEHPGEYGNRYLTNRKTLHRQFLRAKEEHDKPSHLPVDTKRVPTDQQLGDFLETRRRILEKASAHESEIQNPRKKMQG